MSTTQPPGAPESAARSEARFRHELYPYRGQDQFMTGTLGYIREALEADEAVVVAVPEARAALLRGELAGEPAVTFVDTATAGPNPGRLVAAWTAWLEGSGEGGRPVRGVGETAWSQARNAAHLSELRQHEWLLNQAFARSSAWSMLCPYDATDGDQAALRSVSRCHPLIHEDGRNTPNGDFLDAGPYPFEVLPAPCDPYQEVSYTYGDLAAVRSKVAQCASDAGVSQEQQAKLAVAATEIATNSIRHGGGSGTLRTWAQDSVFLCEFRDAGYIADPMAGRIRPSARQLGGRGLWLAHQLCDLVEIRSTPEQGTTVRLHMDVQAR
ncbi:sensor histidine kinase [Streptomyces roseus]|uniref:Antirepressor n=1 Tax=Streptomyces roseus TaxID=66430 RepID=A0A0J7A7Y8_9ACTN|nr:sensor histidine kinase [Streptomyces roseus]KMO93401.1 antirepressor [Streptomyces roseus]